MTRRWISVLTLVVLAGLPACTSRPQTPPTLGPATPDATASAPDLDAPTPQPSPTTGSASPTAALTATPSPVPDPNTVIGLVRFVAGESEPFPTYLELRLPDTFELVQAAEADTNGEFAFRDVHPGEYELWVLLTSDIEMVPGCRDVTVPKGPWRIGIKFGSDQSLPSENPSMAPAILLLQYLQSSDLVPTGIYAVSGLTMEPGLGHYIDLPIVCR